MDLVFCGTQSRLLLLPVTELISSFTVINITFHSTEQVVSPYSHQADKHFPSHSVLDFSKQTRPLPREMNVLR